MLFCFQVDGQLGHNQSDATSEADRTETLLHNAYISTAADGHLVLKVVELPQLTALSDTVEDIPEAVRAAAARIAGRAAEDFDVHVDY